MNTKPESHKPNTYHARDLDSLRNGSFHRKTTRKGEYAQYMNGDFICFVKDFPENLSVHLTRREAVQYLPACNR